jgi:EmrB/QacA subfamily drug resistance transporter
MSRRRRLIVTLGVMGGSFLAAIEATIVATAMPTVVQQLGGLAHYSWVFSAYLLTATVTIPIWGKLSDLYGRRAFYMSAVGLFLLGSALSGVSQTMYQLVIFRAVQGLGAGGLLPLGMTIIGDMYNLKERARMQALFGIVWGLASIAGPVAGGYVTEVLGWRWVFYLNLPFGIAAAALVGGALIESKPHENPKIDYRGAVVLSAAITALLVALSQTGVEDRSVPPVGIFCLYAASAGLFVLFVRLERGAAEPIMPLDLIRSRLVGTVAVCGFLVGVAMFGAISFVPLFVQSALGTDPTGAGLALTPLLLGWVSMSMVSGRLIPRIGYRPLLLTGLTFVTAGFLGLIQVHRGISMWPLYADLGVMGMGMGMTMLTLLLAMQNAVPKTRLGIATSLGVFTRSIGGAVGVALMGAIIAASLPAAAASASPDQMEHALHRAFIAGGILAALALVMAFRVPPGLPGHLSPEADTAVGGGLSTPGPGHIEP